MERTEIQREPFPSPPEGEKSPVQKDPAVSREPETGVLRSDIILIAPGEHGNYPMLFDPLSEHYYKLTERAGRILRLLDKNYPLPVFLKKVNNAGMDADQEEILALLSFLQQNSLMVPGYGAVNIRYEKYRKLKQSTWLNRVLAIYMFFRLPPIYPDRFFTLTMPWMRGIFNRFTVGFLSLCALTGYLLMVRQWNNAYTEFVDSLSWTNLVNYFWALLVTKTIHELSHGYTAKSFGAHVRSMGVSFIVFYPRLFVDLTDSWRLSRFKRLLCDGAGICSELIFGGLAAIVWCYSRPGPLHSTMFYLMMVSALGTILVNGNPFIRYDGYYLLCDLLNIDNLMQRSQEYLKAMNRKLFLGLGEYPESGDSASGITLYFFGLGAFVYKLFLYTSIILIIYFQFTKALALLLMALEFYTMLVMPFIMEVKIILMHLKKLNIAKTLITLLLLGALISLLFIPLPWSYTLDCELVPETSVIVTVRESGFAAEKLSEEPQKVRKGQVILSLNNVFLDFNIKRYASRIKTNEAELELSRSDQKTMGLTPVLFEKLRVNILTRNEMIRRRSEMEITSPAEGVFVPRIKEVSPGRYLEKGMVLGKVISPRNTLYAYAPDNEVTHIRPGSKVLYCLRGEIKKQSGVVSAINPVPVTFRDSALVQQLGGTIACYPKPQNMEFIPVNVLYRIEIKTDKDPGVRSGRIGLAYVQESYKLYQVIYRQILHVFFREFSF